jgi:hypothetical protein
MSATFSIDRAVSGFLRHRFIRAMGASWIALILVGLLAMVVYSAASNFRTDPVLGLVAVLGYVVAAPIMLVVVFLPTILLTAIGGAVVDSVHRRLAALIALPACLTISLAALLLVVGLVHDLFVPRPSAQPAQDLALIAFMALAGLTALEGAGWAWWQLTASREEFLAARGYRPPPWNLFSTFPRQLGLPPFISYMGGRRGSIVLLYFAEALLNAGVVCLLLLPFLFIALPADGNFTSVEDREGFVFAISLLAGLLLLNLFRAGRIIDWLADRRATRLYQDVRDWDARAPVLFLRAFDQDRARLPALTRDPFVKFPSGVGRPRTLDEILLEHASCYGPVIAVGDPRDPVPPLGAARVFAPDEGQSWREIVAALVGASKAVVICPNDTEGVRWELDLIASAGARPRTIYLANPEIPAAASEILFARLAPEGAVPVLPKRQKTIAAFVDPKGGWRVLTTSRRPCLQTYVIALNMALQALLGEAKPSRVVFRTAEEMRDALKAFREGRRVTLFSDDAQNGNRERSKTA